MRRTGPQHPVGQHPVRLADITGHDREIGVRLIPSPVRLDLDPAQGRQAGSQGPYRVPPGPRRDRLVDQRQLDLGV